MADRIVGLTRVSARVSRITYTNPPVNLIVGQAVSQLAATVDDLMAEPELQVLVFDSGTPDSGTPDSSRGEDG